MYGYDAAFKLAILAIILYILFVLLMLSLTAGSLILMVCCIVDIGKRQWPNSSDRILWILLVIFFGFIGQILYITIGRKSSFFPAQCPQQQ